MGACEITPTSRTTPGNVTTQPHRAITPTRSSSTRHDHAAVRRRPARTSSPARSSRVCGRSNWTPSHTAAWQGGYEERPNNRTTPSDKHTAVAGLAHCTLLTAGPLMGAAFARHLRRGGYSCAFPLMREFSEIPRWDLRPRHPSAFMKTASKDRGPIIKGVVELTNVVGMDRLPVPMNLLCAGLHHGSS